MKAHDVNKSENIIFAHPKLLHARVTAMDNNGNVSHGFLVGLKADTLLLSIGKERFKHSLKDLIHVSIDIEKNNSKGLLLGSVLGVYLGSFAFMQTENQPAAYFNDIETFPLVLLSLLSATVGGGLGYLIEKSSSNDQEVFSFSNDPTEWSNDFQKLKKFITGKELEKKIHISVQFSQVNTRYSELHEAQDYYYDEVTSFNLLRSIYITYSIFNSINIGMGICWFGEPSFNYYNYDYNYYNNNNNSLGVEQQFDGMGYYAVGTYEPLKNMLANSLSWEIGMGVGIGNIDYKLNITKGTSFEYEQQYDHNDINIKKTLFSGIIYSNLNYLLYDGLSMGLSFDYVYLPKTMPAISEMKLESRNFGNYSLGLNFGLHF
jgi:hypothetical protein